MFLANKYSLSLADVGYWVCGNLQAICINNIKSINRLSIKYKLSTLNLIQGYVGTDSYG